MNTSHDLDENFNIPPRLTIPVNGVLCSHPKLLEQIDSVLLPTAAEPGHSHIAVLSGLEGVGKTQLAIEYADSRKDSFSSIFWINAENRKSIENSFNEIAQSILQHHNRQKPGSERQVALNLSLPPPSSKTKPFTFEQESEQAPKLTVQAVKEWLVRKHNSRWLLIFDNLKLEDVDRYIPTTLRGQVIITTRFQGYFRYGTTINVGRLGNEQALQLLLNQIDGNLAELSQEGKAIGKCPAFYIRTKLQ